MRKTFQSFAAFVKSSKRTLLLIIIVAAVSISITTAIAIMLNDFHNLSVPSLGTVKVVGVEAYWDVNLENRTETIEWGVIQPGHSVNATFYIQSVSNIKTVLNLNTSDWIPVSISEYMDLSWNYDGRILNPGEVIQVTLYMSAASYDSFIHYLIANDVQDFSLDIHLVATELESA